MFFYRGMYSFFCNLISINIKHKKLLLFTSQSNFLPLKKIFNCSNKHFLQIYFNFFTFQNSIKNFSYCLFAAQNK
jgi:hypothetical protein